MTSNFNSSGDWTLPSVVLMGCWLSLLILIGVFGNILVIIVSLQGTRVRTRGKSLIVSMACADMLESVNMVFMLITVVEYGEWTFNQRICDFHGFVNTLFIIASMLSMATISANRYFLIVKSNSYQRVFSKRNTLIMITFIWLCAFIFGIPPLWGWSRYQFEANTISCTFDFAASIPYSVVLIGSVLLSSLTVILYCSYKIFRQVRHHKIRIRSMLSRQPTGGSTTNLEEIHVTKTLAIIICAYLLCFLPKSILVFVELVFPGYHVNSWIGITATNFIFINHANNPIIYGLFNRQYRQAFKDIFKKLARVKNQTNKIQVATIPTVGLVSTNTLTTM